MPCHPQLLPQCEREAQPDSERDDRDRGLHLKPIGEPDSSVGRFGSYRLDSELHVRICSIESVKHLGRNLGVRIVTPFRQVRPIDPEKTALRPKPERAILVLYHRNELRAGQAIMGVENCPAMTIPADQSTERSDQERIISIRHHGLDRSSDTEILQLHRLELPVPKPKNMVRVIGNPDAALRVGSQKTTRDKVLGKRDALQDL